MREIGAREGRVSMVSLSELWRRSFSAIWRTLRPLWTNWLASRNRFAGTRSIGFDCWPGQESKS